LYGTFSGRDTLRFWGTLYRLSDPALRMRVDELLVLVGLQERADERVETYSRGMKQRLHLARGLLARPSLLLLDEPTIGLDPVAAREIREVVRQLQREGTTILLTTHYMAEAQSLCERVAFINEGRIVRLDTPAALTRAAAEVTRIEAALPAAGLADLRSRIAAFAGTELDVSDDGGAEVVVRVRVTSDSVSHVIAAFGEAGATRVSTAEPTLEDVYLRLLGDRGVRV
jgi:ABC-2 type transport system ATP-binding protein